LAKLKAEEEKSKQEAEALREKEIREDERRKIEEEIRQEKMEDSRLQLISLKKENSLCNVPFSVYFVKQCKVKSRKKPLFDIEALVESMMQ